MRSWGAFLTATILVLCALFPGVARAGDVAAHCEAAAPAGTPTATMLAGGAWRCDGVTPDIGIGAAYARFILKEGDGPAEYFSTRATLVDALTFTVARGGRIVASARIPSDRLRPNLYGQNLVVRLPAIARPGDTVLVRFDAPMTRGMVQDAKLLASNPLHTENAVRSSVLAAVVCGMLIMPLLFSAAFYRVLRERFVFWHILLTSGLLVQCLLTSGVLGVFLTIPLESYFRIGVLSFGFAVTGAAAFGAAFIEPDRLDPRLRKGLYAAGIQVLFVSVIHAFFPRLLGPAQSGIYYASFIPVVAIFIAVSFDAWRRRSRAVRFQLIGWAPFILVGIYRIVTMLVPSMHQSEAFAMFYAAMFVQAMAISVGVGDRFMAIKRQRDQALARADVLERLSERDDLTGLYNRRALDGPLGDFATQKFTGFALFDLDNFKRVNDSHGHAIGDEVLKTVAGLLSAHDNSVALRMGGEEFLLLLRGERVEERVERLREAIPVRIAREVQALDMLVTSSAGLVEADPGRHLATSFTALYQAADDLLYEAKHNGRNLLAAMKEQPTGGDTPDLDALAVA